MDEKSLKPQLRFKGFADAWEQRKFQDIFSFERPDNYIVKSDKYSNEYTMPVLTANKAFVLGYTKENSPCTKTSLIFDDFTLECKYVDFPYMVKSSAIKILTVKDSKKDNLRFSFERLNTTKIEILGHARHYISVVQPTETRTPEIAEQNKISAFFSNLDNLITLHQRKLDKLSNVKKALLEKMFPKNDSDVPEIRFKGFTDAWEQRKFQDIFSFERPDNYIVKSDKYSNEYTMPVLTANKAFVLGYTKENSPCTKTSLIFDDFTLECKYVDFPYMVKSSAIKILTVKDSKKDNLRFSFERLNTTKIEILGHARHYISVVQPTETRTPEIAEQNKISAFFSNLDNLITLHQRKLEKLKNIKKACLEKMFV